MIAMNLNTCLIYPQVKKRPSDARPPQWRAKSVKGSIFHLHQYSYVPLPNPNSDPPTY